MSRIANVLQGLCAVVVLVSLGCLTVAVAMDHPRISLTLGIAAVILVCSQKIEQWHMNRIVRRRCPECGRVQAVKSWWYNCRFHCSTVISEGVSANALLVDIPKSQWGPYSRKQLAEMYCAEESAWHDGKPITFSPETVGELEGEFLQGLESEATLEQLREMGEITEEELRELRSKLPRIPGGAMPEEGDDK